MDIVQFSKLALSTSARYLRLTKCNFQSCDCPVRVEGATESPDSQLAAPRDLLYTGITPPMPPRISRPVRGACARTFRKRLTGAQPMSHYLGKTR